MPTPAMSSRRTVRRGRIEVQLSVAMLEIIRKAMATIQIAQTIGSRNSSHPVAIHR